MSATGVVYLTSVFVLCLYHMKAITTRITQIAQTSTAPTLRSGKQYIAKAAKKCSKTSVSTDGDPEYFCPVQTIIL